jgi:hypothetical protein
MKGVVPDVVDRKQSLHNQQIHADAVVIYATGS